MADSTDGFAAYDLRLYFASCRPLAHPGETASKRNRCVGTQELPLRLPRVVGQAVECGHC